MITQSHRAAAQGDFQHGHSKQHRSDLPQLKTMPAPKPRWVATLDPLAMPLVSLTVSGNTADDILYLPVIEQCEALGLEHQLFVGDSKMSNISTRGYLQSKGHYYLPPLSKKQCSQEQLNQYLSEIPSIEGSSDGLIEIYTTSKDSKVLKAKTFEVIETLQTTLSDGTSNGSDLSWNERRLMVYSPSYAKVQQTAFEKRIHKVQTDLAVLLEAKQGRKKLNNFVEVEQAVNHVLKKYKVQPFINVEIKESVQTKTLRKYKNKPQREVSISTFSIEVNLDKTSNSNTYNN